ncbi:PAS domain S-box-containing protein [Luteibacter rhizovicinus]|uniref:histidine kinase n=1 Tax=Luteibacter rhizovicinus TaxID=242606 RepID=A0A4R3YQY3_9GAMM|nr:PAS domain-containing sensor histidine kinase [Luteibacter rhizovicinus]TCV94038.1 PAS domain S-box-containing protein [Luteibacter rhizovicinus]
MANSTDGKYREYVEASADCIKELDPDGVIRFIGGRGAAVLGFDNPADALGVSWIDLWPADAREMVARSLATARSGTRVTFACTRPSPGGALRWWDVSVTPVLADDGSFDHFIVISRDITDRVQLQVALESINERLQDKLNETVASSVSATSRYGTLLERLAAEHDALEAAERRLAQVSTELNMATTARRLAEESARQAHRQQAIGQLVGGIAHDFNNMLQTVIVSLSGLEEDIELLAPQHRKMLRYAVEGSRHATALTRRLLAFARTHPAHPEPLDLVQVVNEFGDFARHGMGGRIGLVVETAEERLPAYLDRHALEQALMNLCLNARDAMTAGGTVRIELFARELVAMPGVSLRDRGAGRYVAIAVSDSGEGMSEAVRQRLFEPYFTTRAGGSGLGLAEVYGSVAQAGGFIEVESEAGRGTRIQLVFPRYFGVVEPMSDSVRKV